MKTYYQIKVVLSGDWRARTSVVRRINDIPEDASCRGNRYQSETDTTIMLFIYEREI